jgi:hypothetical protein
MAKLQYLKAPNGRVFTTEHPEYYNDSVRVSAAEGDRELYNQARASLLEMIEPGSTIYARVRSVSSSGMSRTISLFVVYHGKMVDITCRASVLLGWKIGRDGGLKVSGCSMDMGFYYLGSAMWPHGTPEPHGTRNGVPDNAGGYALKYAPI